jgi:Protein of unknown function (DUF4058)
MPIHDWTRVPAGTFHFFHQRWIQDIADTLNAGGLPQGYFAMSEVDAIGSNADKYARRADRLSIYLPQGELIAVIEIVSPGNKNSANELKTFVRKAGKLLRRGVHLLIVDLFPPSIRDPQGIHKAIWDQFKEEPFDLPPDKPLTLAAYTADSEKVAYVENVAVGDQLPDMPIFLTPDRYVLCPLESSYQVAWGMFPGALKGPLELPPK